jgi:hypothetical protein
MSNDREAFEKAIVEDGYAPPVRSKHGGYLFEDDVNRYAGWLAAQSRHAAELARIQDALDTRNAQMRNIGNALNPHAKSMLWDNIADGAVERITGHAAEREALIRKCLEICEVERNGYDEPLGGWDRSNPTHAEYFGYQEACNDIYKKILALLDSGSQG